MFLVPSSLDISLAIVFVSFLPLLFAGFFIYFGPLSLWIKFNLMNLDSRPLQQIMMQDDDTYGILPINTQKANDY